MRSIFFFKSYDRPTAISFGNTSCLLVWPQTVTPGVVARSTYYHCCSCKEKTVWSDALSLIVYQKYIFSVRNNVLKKGALALSPSA